MEQTYKDPFNIMLNYIHALCYNKKVWVGYNALMGAVCRKNNYKYCT
jgi:hypothetical protein